MKIARLAMMIPAIGFALGATAETTRYWYDEAGRLTGVGYAVAVTNTAAIQYEYDINGNRTNVLALGRGDTANTDGDDLRDVDELAFFGDLTQTGSGDFDAAGLATSNELAFGSDPALRDTDGDDSDDREEWIADTAPNNPNSYFHILAISNEPMPGVCFDSSTNRVYTMQAATNMANSAWSNVPGSGPRAGAGGMDLMQDTNEPLAGPFYRLDVQLP